MLSLVGTPLVVMSVLTSSKHLRGFQQVHALSDVIKLYTWAHYITQNTAAMLEFCHLHIIYAKLYVLSSGVLQTLPAHQQYF